ncbi:hypothetical protein HanXRQr2_Chr09g0383651 [Helianthus annuus]|uniref:Uncharacterized protein n=1 Tax=Helianthus annuus TaxID=4232 RepID=A0A9K3I4W1_HELAN|nr:hypothetical protein HanXRQr2_Chr09g0383651 [Helianthus annuus]KAJ0533903.1 hypothetical protein HanIR_Chr09g0413751 [Helianthus annuus]KAJ0707131.1 hypothetical protein HanLR1_Chr09g0315091 [Helianthus annuus]KAJ0711152.1 hypothetical protein HanOQP8_Chr09g0320671 [Helianthus annuus]
MPQIFKFIGKDLSYEQVNIGTLIFHGRGYSRQSITSISALGISFFATVVVAIGGSIFDYDLGVSGLLGLKQVRGIHGLL